MDTALYVSGAYLEKHPTWHVEDSAWKANHVLGMIERHKLAVGTVVEIGCGAGEILHCLQSRLPGTSRFTGHEISPQAFSLCSSRENAQLEFRSTDGLAGDEPQADLVLALDVLEHVEDYPAFLRGLAQRGKATILHIPLDLSLLSLLTGLPVRVRRTAGHLHYFTRAMALEALTSCGFRIVDAVYTRPAMERPNGSLRGKLARLPRLAMAAVNEGAAAMLLGGFSLLVLAEPVEKRGER